MLTARGQDIDRIVGLEIGADDYLAKPFNARELLARMHAVLRRSQAGAAQGVLAVGDVVIDVRARTVRRGGEPVELTSLEFELLKVLVAAAGDVVSREALFEQVLRREYNVFDRSIDNHVSSLRKKLGPRVGDAERIRSIRNAGYRIRAHGASAPSETASMGRLFLRIFLWFWVGSTCLLLVLAASLLIARPEIVSSWRVIRMTAMLHLGTRAIEAYEQEGPAPSGSDAGGHHPRISLPRLAVFRRWLADRGGGAG